MRNSRQTAAGFVALTLWILIGIALPVAALASGSGPADAQAPSPDWQVIKPGQEHWYGFYYPGDGSPIEIRLQTEPPEGASFGLFTPDGIRRWSDGDPLEPVGRGLPLRSGSATQIWTGSFYDEGAYFVVVEHEGQKQAPSYYLLEIEGDGVSLSIPSPSTEVTPAPKTSTPGKATISKPAGKLVFQTSMGGDIYTINVDGTGLQRMTDGMDPTWSPDGSQIAFNRWSEPRGVWVTNADGSQNTASLTGASRAGPPGRRTGRRSCSRGSPAAGRTRGSSASAAFASPSPPTRTGSWASCGWLTATFTSPGHPSPRPAGRLTGRRWAIGSSLPTSKGCGYRPWTERSPT